MYGSSGGGLKWTCRRVSHCKARPVVARRSSPGDSRVVLTVIGATARYQNDNPAHEVWMISPRLLMPLDIFQRAMVNP